MEQHPLFVAEIARLTALAPTMAPRFGESAPRVLLLICGAHIDGQCLLGLVQTLASPDDVGAGALDAAKALVTRVEMAWVELALDTLFPGDEKNELRNEFIAILQRETELGNAVIEGAYVQQFGKLS